MSTSHRAYSSRLVPTVASKGRTPRPSLLSAILSQWPLIWARGAPTDASALPDYLRRDIGLPPAEPQRTHWDYR